MSSPRWTRWFQHFQKDCKLFLIVLALLAIDRLILFGVFRDRMAVSVKGTEFIAAALKGFRYDARVATYFLSPCIIFAVLNAFRDWKSATDRFRRVWATLLFALCLVMGIVNWAFIVEFQDQFNHWVWGVVYDDFGAVLKTVWHEQPVIWALLAIVACCYGFQRLTARWLTRPWLSSGWVDRRLSGKTKRAALTLLIIILFVGALRGSLGRRPVQLKDAAITSDAFLNKLILNPFTALRYAIKAHLRRMSSRGLKDFLPDSDVRAAATRVFPDRPPSDLISDYLLQKASGAPGQAPDHIFVVIMESMDSWLFQPEYRDLDLVPVSRHLAREGLFIEGFLPSGRSTSRAFCSLITGIPSTGIYVNYQPTSRSPYPTSLAPIFKKLGYRTRLIHGGYLSWHRIGEFARDQGFDEVIGGNILGTLMSGNEWGVDDEVLFSRTTEIIDFSQPSFNIIHTTSYHPPYDVDVFGKGFKLESMPKPLASRHDGRISMKTYGHLWYSDQCLGDFVKKVTTAAKRPLFAITGDHYGRRFIDGRPKLYEKTSVPCILYGPRALEGLKLPEKSAGSHVDMLRTLVELAAPRGFRFASFGKNLLRPQAEPVGYGELAIIGHDWVADLSDPPRFEAIPGQPTPTRPLDLSRYRQRWGDLHGLAWWLVLKGDLLPPKNQH